MMASILNNWQAAAVLIVAVLVGFNSVMTVIKKILDRLAPASGADGFVSKVCGFLQKLIEFASANSTVLPQKAQDELSSAAVTKAAV